MEQKNREIGAIILAAGRGKRMNLAEANKVTLPLAGKPIVQHIVDFMYGISIGTIVVVIGHAKDSVQQALAGQSVLFAEQTEQLGTGHAAACALKIMPDHITDVCVVYGDDAVLYGPENQEVIERLFKTHLESEAAFSFLTIEQDDPAGLGRVLRDGEGKLLAIVEEKDASVEQKQVKEINPGCFIFRVSFLKQYLPLIEKSLVTDEYYLTSLIDLAIINREHVEAVRGGKLKWRGVNTPEELIQAEKLIQI
jgi:bifunctional N-acetylglucosamine-1-phosphate-uridyltransferase/glucosamine-1-phosphate-acetyltransferase GlmU-like protein